MLLLVAALLGCGATTARTHPRERPAADTALLAAEIDRAQASVDNPSASRAELQKAARSEQLAFVELAGRPRLRRGTLARLSSSARSAMLTALRAGDALAKIVPRERRFPAWRIIAPPPAARLLDYFRAAGRAYRIPWQYLAAIEFVETRMGRIRGVSPAGAQAPMQFMPATWAEYGRGSIRDQQDSIMAAARFLAANGGGERIGAALFHYNPSQSYVLAWPPTTATTSGKSSIERTEAHSSCRPAIRISARNLFLASVTTSLGARAE